MKYKACERCARNVGTVNVIGNILMIVIKGYMGIAGRSKGLIADAIHSCADLLATIVMIIGLRISSREADEKYPYGYGKAEYIVSILIYLFLFAIGIYIVGNGMISIVDGQTIQPCLSAAWGAVFSIAINELMFRQSVCAGTQINSPSMVAKAWESRSDVYSSIAVLVGIIGAKMGFHFMDPLAAIVVGIIILKICVEMVKDAVNNLMDKAPEEELISLAHKALEGVGEIRKVRNIFAREIGQYIEFELELLVDEALSISQGDSIKKQVQKIVSDCMDRKSVVKIRLYAY